MPIISRIGRRSWGARAWLGGFYALLLLGAVTMVYPFLLMLATSVTGPADSESFDLFPKYLYRDEALFVRVISEKYLGGDGLADQYGLDVDAVPLLKVSAVGQVRRALGDQIGWSPESLDSRRLRQLQEYEAFLRSEAPDELVQIGFEREVGVPRLADRLYWGFLREKYGVVEEMNRAYGETRETFFQARFPLERVMYRAWTPPKTKRFDDYREFKARQRSQRPEMFQGFVGDVAWQRHLQNRFDSRIAELNHAWGTTYPSFASLKLPETRSAAGTWTAAGREGLAEAEWDDFVRRKWSPRHMRWDPRAAEAWRAFLRHVYEMRAQAASSPGAPPAGDALSLLNAAHERQYRTFDEIALPPPADLRGSVSADFYAFLRGGEAQPVRADTALVRLVGLGTEYRNHLAQRYGTLEALNRAYGTSHARWDDVLLPAAAYDWWMVVRDKAAWRWYLATNNYRLVLDLLLFRGNSLANTVAFIVLTILLQTTVNPLCAYALSRFNLPYAEKVLIFLLATMAFPAEVTMIPGFLLLRDLDLLNTFAALLLPSVAQGFSIFILKGFFDALPREVFDAATLDGCGELRLFFQVLVPLSQPVFAYIALLGFTAAYSSFLFALVICQDSRMWTLMVWIYQLQGSVHESAQVAALIVVMVPTILVFALCQRMIMRGVVLPQVD